MVLMGLDELLRPTLLISACRVTAQAFTLCKAGEVMTVSYHSLSSLATCL